VTFHPTAGAFSDGLGHGQFTYTISVFDPALSRNVASHPKTVTVIIRPVPVATGLLTTWYTKENYPAAVDIKLGELIEKKGYWYPNSVLPEYDVHPYDVVRVTEPSGSLGAFGGLFSCSTGAAAKGCTATFNPVASGYGATSFNYKVGVSDALLGQVLYSNIDTVNIEVRPIIRGYDVSHSTNSVFRTVQGQTLNWTMENEATKGYTYSTDPGYASVLGSLDVELGVDTTGGAPTLSDPHCNASHVCSGTFVPAGGFYTSKGMRRLWENSRIGSRSWTVCCLPRFRQSGQT
jgi:hypothetical protein